MVFVTLSIHLNHEARKFLRRLRCFPQSSARSTVSAMRCWKMQSLGAEVCGHLHEIWVLSPELVPPQSPDIEAYNLKSQPLGKTLFHTLSSNPSSKPYGSLIVAPYCNPSRAPKVIVAVVVVYVLRTRTCRSRGTSTESARCIGRAWRLATAWA